MSEELPSLHIDTDWKKQAQEEKKRLAEKAQQAKDAPPPVIPAPVPVPGATTAAAPAPNDPRSAARGGGGRRGAAAPGQRELPAASIATLAQSLMSQALYYLGELAYQGGDPVVGLDMAKHNIDTLTVLEEKTSNNLSDDERHALDVALFESRSRFVSVASQFV